MMTLKEGIHCVALRESAYSNVHTTLFYWMGRNVGEMRDMAVGHRLWPLAASETRIKGTLLSGEDGKGESSCSSISSNLLISVS